VPRSLTATQVAADPTGRVLLAALGYGHPTYIARLNPHTGAVEARTTVPYSINQPSIKGVIDGGAWIYNSGGMERGSWRIAVNTLKPTRTQPLPIPSMQSSAEVINGVLWVTEPGRASRSASRPPSFARKTRSVPVSAPRRALRARCLPGTRVVQSTKPAAALLAVTLLELDNSGHVD
jgi:hypothetical protein